MNLSLISCMLTERFQVSFSTIYTALEGEDSIGTGGRKSFSAIACYKTRTKNLKQRKNLSVLHIGLAIHVASLEYITRNVLAEMKGNVYFRCSMQCHNFYQEGYSSWHFDCVVSLITGGISDFSFVMFMIV